MPEKPQACLFLIVIAAFASPITGTQLPYEVLDSIIELTDTDDDYRDLNRVNVSDVLGLTRPIYRLDLDKDYVAYYTKLTPGVTTLCCLPATKQEIFEKLRVDQTQSQPMW